MKHKTCIIIAGPTAVGKTALALDVARYFETDIISADSRQCFREMSVGVAKPSPEELQSVTHYFINSHSITEEVNAAVFESYALNAVEEIFESHAVAVMTGGTGLYIKAFCEGFDNMPVIEPAVRVRVQEQYRQSGMEWLQAAVQLEDPQYYATGETQNPHRLMRALEVKRATGRSIRDWQQGATKERPFDIVKIGLDRPREELYHRIDKRVDEMMQAGLLEEVRALLPYRHLNALQTVGYTELFEYLDGTTSLAEAVDRIRRNTRHYAKRQLTWFRRDPAIHWFSPEQVPDVLHYLKYLK